MLTNQQVDYQKSESKSDSESKPKTNSQSESKPESSNPGAEESSDSSPDDPSLPDVQGDDVGPGVDFELEAQGGEEHSDEGENPPIPVDIEALRAKVMEANLRWKTVDLRWCEEGSDRWLNLTQLKATQKAIAEELQAELLAAEAAQASAVAASTTEATA